MRFIVSFADQAIASVESVSLAFTYIGALEGSLSSATQRHYLPEIEERIALIEAGKLKGYYCFEPELIDENEFWGDVSRERGKCLKDFAVKAKLSISDETGEYSIVLEWYQSSKELSESPLTELVQRAAGQLKFQNIKKYCKFYDWEDLA